MKLPKHRLVKFFLIIRYYWASRGSNLVKRPFSLTSARLHNFWLSSAGKHFKHLVLPLKFFLYLNLKKLQIFFLLKSNNRVIFSFSSQRLLNLVRGFTNSRKRLVRQYFSFWFLLKLALFKYSGTVALVLRGFQIQYSYFLKYILKNFKWSMICWHLGSPAKHLSALRVKSIKRRRKRRIWKRLK